MRKEDLWKHCETIASGISVSKEESVRVEMTTIHFSVTKIMWEK